MSKITDETFTTLLNEIEADPRRWNGTAGRALLGLLTTNLRGTARAFGRPVEDAVELAWRELSEGRLDGVTGIWKTLVFRLNRELPYLRSAEKLMVSEHNAEKVAAAIRSAVTVEGLPLGFEETAEADVVEAAEVELRLASTQLAVALLMQGSGLSRSEAVAVVDAMLDTASLDGAGSAQNARRRAVSRPEIGEALGCSKSAWVAVAGLLFGSQRGGPQGMGLIEAEVTNLPQPERVVRQARKALGLAA